MIRVEVSVTGAAELLAADAYGAGALLRVERATDVAGPYAEVATQALVTGVEDYTLFDAGGSTTSWYRSRVSNAGGTLFSGYSDPFQVAPANVVANSEVRALVKTSLADAALEEVIAREEAILAADIGPLASSRTDVFVITTASAPYPLRLRRPAAAVVVTEDNATLTDVGLAADGRTLERLAAAGWSTQPWAGVVEVTSTPNDLARVTSWVIELVRARLAETGHASESMGDGYSYDRGNRSHAATLAAAIADILRGSGGRGSGLRSIRMSTAAGPDPWVGTARP